MLNTTSSRRSRCSTSPCSTMPGRPRRPRPAQAAVPGAVRHGHSQCAAGLGANCWNSWSRELKELMPDATWSAAGIGRQQLEVNRWCLELGGHVRTGLEDNIKFDKDRLARSNAELVARLAGLCGEYGRHAASRGEARGLLKLPAAKFAGIEQRGVKKWDRLTREPAGATMSIRHHRVRQRDRHDDRMVRFLPLRHDDGDGTQQAVFSQCRHPDLDAVGLCHLLRRLPVAADRRHHLRPLRRPHRPQDRAHPHPPDHGRRHVPDRPASDLRHRRRLGAAHAAGAAHLPGHRHRR